MFVSVDLGNTHIMMMAAERHENGTLKVLALETEETPSDCIQHGIVKKPADLAMSLSSMAKRLENRLEIKFGKKFDVNRFYIAVNGRSLRSIRDNVEHKYSISTEITAGELSLLRNELQNKIDTDKSIYSITNEEYIVDGEHVRNPNGILCREILANFLIVLGRTDIYDNLKKCIDRVQLTDVNSDALAHLVMANAVLTNDDKLEGVVHMNFGATTTTVVVYQNGYLRHVAVVPFGGKHITNDLANEDCELNISTIEAELLKVQKGTPIDDLGANDVNFKMPSKPGSESRIVSKRKMIKIIRARLAEIVELCMNEVTRSGYKDQLRAGIVVTGGASRLSDFQPFLEQETDMPVRFGSFAHYLDDESVESYSDTEYTLLIGLLLSATEECVSERVIKTEKEPEQPVTPKTGSRLKRIFTVGVGTLFEDPTEPTIK